MNKLSTSLRRLLPNSIHVFEDLDKEDLVSINKAKKARRKRNPRKSYWVGRHRREEYQK